MAGEEVLSTTAIVYVGGKGSSLSAYAVYAVARGVAKVQIDASALERLSSSSTTSRPTAITSACSPTRCLFLEEESRAALLVVLNKLVNADSRGVRNSIPIIIEEALNHKCDIRSLDFGSASGFLTSLCGLSGKDVGGATSEEIFVIENSLAASNGMCGIMDCVASSLTTLLDAVAALSCEAVRANIGAFDSYVSGDGFSVKDATDVAGDMKALLFGSKLTGGVELPCCVGIPTVHGSFRKVVRLLHGESRVELNSVVKPRKSLVSGNDKKERALAGSVLHLSLAILSAAEDCFGRIKLIIDLVADLDLKSKILHALQNDCSSSGQSEDGVSSADNLEIEMMFDSFLNGFRSVLPNDALHSTYCLLVKLLKILAWEAAINLYVLDMDDTIEKYQSTPLPNIELNGETKIEKKRKKKTLGKGTSIVRQLLSERIATKNENFNVGVLSCWVEELFLYFDPKDQGSGILLEKVKEIVQSNEVRRLPKIPKGTRDFGKEQMAIRERAFSIILGVFRRHGAVGLDTPVFELRETLMGKYGEDSKLIYDLADQGGEICSLRYDLTVPFARYLAMNNITALKRYHIGKVYRRDNPSKGRYREFYQCDFDIAGQHGAMEPDFETVKVLTELLNELEIGDYEIKLNHRKLLDGMLEICGVPFEKFRTVCSSIDKLDKQSFQQVKEELVGEKGLTLEVVEKIGFFVRKRGPAFDVLSALTAEGSLFLQNNGSVVALKDLEILFKALKHAKALDKIVFDLSLARGLDYYTGVIFEAVMKGSTQVGSIAAGGRYDNLVGMFSGKQVPAVGASLGIERVFTIMEGLNQSGNQEIRSTETQVLVAVLQQDLTIAAELVAELWNMKIPAEFGVHKNVRKHIKRAEDGEIPWLVIIGELEQAEGIVKLKDMKASKEQVVKRGDIVAELQRRTASSQSSCQRHAIA